MRQSAKILVVDDEAAMRFVAVAMLRRMGFRADAAEDGETAISFFEAAQDCGDPYNLAIMDMVMPGLDGIETSARLRGLDSQIWIVFSSGCVAEGFFEKHMDAYSSILRKPYQMSDLEKVLQEAGCLDGFAELS